MNGEQMRREADRRMDKMETTIENVVNANAAEFDSIHKEQSEHKSWISKHDAQDEERWKANGEKWSENAKKHDDTNFKLNTIIGTSFITLLSVLGFFAAIWVDRMEEKKESKRVDIAQQHQTVQNQ